MRSVTTMDEKRLTKLLSYIIMSDGGVYKAPNATNCQFIMNMTSDHEDFINYIKGLLEQVTTATKYDRRDYNTDGYKRKPQIRLESRAHPKFNVLRNRIYIDGYKGIDPHTIKLLDWESLAILYMSDGSLKTTPAGTKGLISPAYDITLNMKRLSYGDTLLLKRTLKDLLGLEWNVNRQNQYYYLRLRTKDYRRFTNEIRRFILPSFEYKLINYPNDLPQQPLGDDIVCSASQDAEDSRNDYPIGIS